MEVLTQDILVTSILMGVITLVGLVGNALMLRALVHYKQLRSAFYTVFGCLSIVDSLYLVIGVPAHIMDMFLATSQSTDAWCKVSHYIPSACGFIAAYLLVVLAVLRWILLTNRNIVRRPEAKHLVVVCIVISVITLLCSVPVLFMITSYDGICDVVDVNNERARHTWLISSFSTFVPLFLILAIYIMTYALGKRYFSDSYSPREKEKSRLISSMVIAFTICQAPYRIAAIYEVYLDTEDHSQLRNMYIVKNYLMCLLMADKAVRPILYTKLASDLCEAFDEVINCVYCSKHYSMTSTFSRTSNTYSVPVTQSNLTTLIGSTENNVTRSTERTASSSSSASATSQTPLTRKDMNEDMGIDILEE